MSLIDNLLIIHNYWRAHSPGNRHNSVYFRLAHINSLVGGFCPCEAPVTAPPLRVSIVDDDDAVRDSLRVLLDAHGIDVESFATPTHFLRHVGSTKADCFVFDLHMPDMTGLELAE